MRNSRYPLLRSAAAVPIPLSPLIGRGAEVRQIGALLAESRLTTLTGAGGSGKTRLALELAAETARADPAGVAWVDLTSIADCTLTPDHGAAVLEVRPGPGQDALGALVGAVKGRKLLLALDNCEHLVEAAADLVETLLSACPSLSVLTTSREPLGLRGERIWLVPPLSVAQIAERLDDAFSLLTQGRRTALPRHKTLRGTIDWSFRLLSPREQILLRRLSVFAGTFSLDAVEAICPGVGLAASETLDGLSALVDRSLVVLEPAGDEARYRLLETVRQYGVEQLRSAGEEDGVRCRHAGYFADLAETLAPELFAGATSSTPLAHADADHCNFRTAFDWARTGEATGATVLRLATALHWYWFARGLLAEGRKRFEIALAAGEQAPPAVRARAQVAYGLVSFSLGRPRDALSGLHQALAVLRQDEDLFALTYGLAILGAASMFDDPSLSSTLITEARERMEGLPPSVMQAYVLYWEGRISLALGDRPRARRALEGCVADGYRRQHLISIAHGLFALSRLEWEEGNLEVARNLLTQALEVHSQMGDRYGVRMDLRLLGLVAAALGRHGEAARLAAASRGLAEELGIRENDSEAPETAELDRTLRETLGATRLAAAAAEGRSLGPAGLLKALQADRSPAAPPSVEAAPGVTGAATPEPCGAHPTPSGEASEAAAEPELRVDTLGPLSVRRVGTAGEDAAWRAARTRELLVFLLLHPAGATKEEIGLALWPEASASQVRNSLHVALHRLRTALGNPESVRAEAGRYRFDPALPVRFDVLLFERQARTALAELRHRPGAVAELLEALGLYRGELLAGESAGEWHLEHRERLRHLFLEGLAAASRTLETADRWGEAADLYRRWIAADDLAEHAYRRLMACLDRTGNRAEALKLYRRLEATLKSELDVPPEPESVALFEQLQRASRPSS